MEPLRKVVEFFEELFPPSFALPEDRIGLQVQAKGTVDKILVALELNHEVFQKAVNWTCDFLYLHHSPLWEPLRKLSCEDPLFRMLGELYTRGISVLVHHTNLDIAPQGIGDQWLKLLDLRGDTKPLLPATHLKKYKVVTFVPPTHLDAVLEALFQEGAGVIGSYRNCAFLVSGTGTFLPEEDTHPFIGTSGKQEKVEEIRVEVEVPSAKLNRVLEALVEVHPYEQPAIDVYPLVLPSKSLGLGRVVSLSAPLSGEEIRERLSRLSVPFEFTGGDGTFGKIALCPGSGRTLLPKVIEERADLFVTGDLTHHDIEALRLFGIAYLHIPHGISERRALREVALFVRKKAQERGLNVNIAFEEEVP
ncbi:MAG: Nif3-like dinuclear metal center hexameric protein [Candidatus Caldatribacterium sp.]|nr:Nif3-like dinuclear metal center hexameric protein [Candidatus Caldatribacterium sp.]